MKKYIYIFKQNQYILHIATLMSGTLIAQIITLGFLPILTRLYTPTEFGLYSLFLSVISIIGSVSSLKYDQAIMLPKSDKDASALVVLSLFITLFITLCVTFMIFIFYDFFIDYFHGKTYIIWLIPIGVFIVGVVQVLSALSSRKQQYKALSSVRVVNSASLVTVQVLSKLIFKFDGLIVGKLFTETVTALLLVIHQIKTSILHLKSPSLRRLKVNATKYKDFPKYQSVTVLLNAVSQNIPILLLASFYSAEIAGLYALTTRVLQAPVGLIGGSTRQVYYQRASKIYSENKDIFPIFKKTVISLFKIFIIPFFIILIFGEQIFSILFGKEWEESGMIAQILILWILFLFINSPAIATFSIINLQKKQMYIEFISVLLRFISIYTGYYFFNSYIVSIILFALSSSIINIYIIFYIYILLKNRSVYESN